MRLGSYLRSIADARLVALKRNEVVQCRRLRQALYGRLQSCRLESPKAAFKRLQTDTHNFIKIEKPGPQSQEGLRDACALRWPRETTDCDDSENPYETTPKARKQTRGGVRKSKAQVRNKQKTVCVKDPTALDVDSAKTPRVSWPLRAKPKLESLGQKRHEACLVLCAHERMGTCCTHRTQLCFGVAC
jgi:hypothetical protein